MKKFLLPLAILLTIPFNTSCIQEITFNVTISAEHCQYEAPKKVATMGRNYIVNIISIEEGYMLEEYVDYFQIATKKFPMVYPGEAEWEYKNNQLIIYGGIVTSDLEIKITALEVEQYE